MNRRAFAESVALAALAPLLGAGGPGLRLGPLLGTDPATDALLAVSDEPSALARAGLWLTAGLLLLFGVTGELRRHFVLASSSAETAGLAGGLAVSAWWLVFASALVLLGFRRALKPVRLAGLAVAGLAVVKVIMFDLAALDALYRVGSVFLLALVALSLAYLYYRHDRSQQA